MDTRIDTRIFNVLNNTSYEGVYITDIIKCVSTRDSNDLEQKIKNGEINMDAQSNIFFDEVNILGNDNIKIYLMGKYTEEIFNQFVSEKIKIR